MKIRDGKAGPAFREDLEKMKCVSPACTAPEGHAVVLRSICHGDAIRVLYTPGTGVVTLVCQRCSKFVTGIAVAARTHTAEYAAVQDEIEDVPDGMDVD